MFKFKISSAENRFDGMYLKTNLHAYKLSYIGNGTYNAYPWLQPGQYHSTPTTVGYKTILSHLQETGNGYWEVVNEDPRS